MGLTPFTASRGDIRQREDVMKVRYSEITGNIVLVAPVDEGDILCSAPTTPISREQWDSKHRDFIVRAVNCHEQLVEALRGLVMWSPIYDPKYAGQLSGPLNAARAALAAAKGE
jgi:hypothetical protein